MYRPKTKEEEEFLQSYDSSKYEKPSVTADVVIFTVNERNKLSVLLIKRRGFPYKDCWAIPGGFVNMDESIDEAAARELEEETHLSGIDVVQFGSFGDVDRDPRMRVISIAYLSLIPKEALKVEAGDDACDAQIFEIRQTIDGIGLIGNRNLLNEKDLAFDHAEILRTAIKRLRNRIEYMEDAFALLEDDESFAILELKKIYEAVLDKSLDSANFHRDFIKKYVKTGLVVETGCTGMNGAKMYRKVK